MWGEVAVRKEVRAKVGRPPKRAEGGLVSLTVRVPAEVKNLLVDQCEAFGLTLTEYLVALVVRDAAASD